MKTTIYTLCTAALLLASCANDPAEDILAGTNGANGGDLPQGTFVIDYTASTGDAQTRIPANKRIQSLDYLLYEKAADGDFLLKKKRSIPGIGEETHWPLTRENMTWEQREALKDTLNTNCKYKMVFVANADPEIWDNSPVLENVDEDDNTFDQGRLVLPPRLFTDNDMYYMWSNHDAPLDGSNYNKDNPASMEITLERMINKVEVKLDEDVVNGIEAAAGESYAKKVDAYCARLANEYYEKLITKNYNSEEEAGKLYNSMKDCMEALTEGLALDWDGQYLQYKDALTKLKTAISGEAFIDNVCTDYFSPENSPIRTDIENILKELYKKYCFWNKDGKTYVKVMHNPAQNAYANKIGFDKKTYGSTDEDKNQYSVQNNAFIYYRFGNNNTGESVLNQVTEFRFLNAENNIDFSITGNAFPISNHQQGNQYLIFECNPIGSQTPFKGAIAKEDAIQTYTIENFSIPAYYCKIEGNSWDDDHFNFSGLRNINEFTEQLNSGSNYPESDYIEFTSIEEITLKIKAPIVTVSPTWEQNQ